MFPAHLRRMRASSLSGGELVAAQKFVPLDFRNNSDSSDFTLDASGHAPQTSDTHGACQRNFVRQGQQYLYGRTTLHSLGQNEVNAPGADICGFRLCFADRRTAGPADGHRQLNLESLVQSAFRCGHRGLRSIRCCVFFPLQQLDYERRTFGSIAPPSQSQVIPSSTAVPSKSFRFCSR